MAWFLLSARQSYLASSASGWQLWTEPFLFLEFFCSGCPTSTSCLVMLPILPTWLLAIQQFIKVIQVANLCRVEDNCPTTILGILVLAKNRDLLRLSSLMALLWHLSLRQDLTGGDCGKWIIIPESNICSIQNSSSLGSSQHPLVTPGLLSYQDSIVLYFWPHLPHLYSHMSLAHPQMTCLYINIISAFTSSCKRTHVSWCEHHGYLFPIHLRVVTSVGTRGRTEREKRHS